MERPLPSFSHRPPGQALLKGLTRALIAGEDTPEAALERLHAALGREWRWVPKLVLRYRAVFAEGVRPRRLAVIAFLAADRGLRRACERHGAAIRIARPVAESARMQPVPALSSFPLPAIESIQSLAEWLSVSADELAWFAELKRLTPEARPSPLGHYHYRPVAKAYGAVRLIEAPKDKLKTMQRRILSEILDWIPLHPAVHGFCRGRSIRTFAAPHVGRTVVLKMDLQDFFPSITRARVQALFRTMGYPEPVAELLGGVCTHVTPRFVWRETGLETTAAYLREARTLYGRPHLPQGAPTSPALANLCAYRLDCRLHGLAEAAGGAYTRYADDLVFSGYEGFSRMADRFLARAAAIAAEEGFHVHHRKTRVMRQGVRQQVAGVVLNRKTNYARDEFDRLKAILTNCRRLGPVSQNRDGHASFREHLAGRVEHVRTLHAERGERLRAIFDGILWPDG